jgi:hypothetical protein
MALFKHKLTGEIIEAPEHYLGHPFLGVNLIPVDANVEADEAETKTKKTKGFSLGKSTENNEE